MKWLYMYLILILGVNDAYKILTIFPLPSKSHNILGDGLIRHLLDAGHEVTYITAFPKRKPHPMLHVIDVSENRAKLNGSTTLDIKKVMNRQFDLNSVNFVNEMFTNTAVKTMENPNVLNLIREPAQEFDLVIAEWVFTEMFCVMPAIFDVPLIWVSTIEPHWLIMSLIDEPLNPAYNADYKDEFQPPFTFIERVQVLWNQIYALWLKEFKYYYKEEAVYQRLIAPILKQKGKPVPSYQELRYNASLILGNSHVSLGSPTRLPVNYKPVAGYHIEDHAKPLPEDLKKIMDNANNGVIYFSMGSNLNSKNLPHDLKKGLLEVFRGLVQTVIWKFEEIIPDVPKNVHIVQWAPQPGILAHPNCILFITHGGLLSLTESVHYGVPVIAIPVFSDQFVNSARVTRKGYGVKLDLSNTFHEELGPAIDEVLRNPKYAQKVKELSFVYHDRTMPPGKEVLHWVNHVIKTKGAPHLRSHALLVPMYQKLYLDLVAVIIIVVVIIKLSMKRFLRMLYKRKLD